jgi:hypothetical protein
MRSEQDFYPGIWVWMKILGPSKVRIRLTVKLSLYLIMYLSTIPWRLKKGKRELQFHRSWFRHSMKVSWQLHAPSASPPRMSPHCLLNRRRGGTLSRSGRYVEKNLALAGNRTAMSHPIAYILKKVWVMVHEEKGIPEDLREDGLTKGDVIVCGTC